MKYVPTHTTLHFQINILWRNWFVTLAAISHVEKMLNAGHVEGRRYAHINMNWQYYS